MNDPLVRDYNNNQVSRADNDLSTKEKLSRFKKDHNFWYEVLKFAALVIFVVLPFRALVAQPFMVSGVSMEPTFHNNDYLIVNQLSKRFGSLERYDVVVFKAPSDESKYYIKRIIGLPGETVTVKEGIVTVISHNNNNPIIIDDYYTQGETFGYTDITLGSEEYFVLGDNRQNSSDSRVWGTLPSENIIGTPFLRLLPLSDASINPGMSNP